MCAVVLVDPSRRTALRYHWLDVLKGRYSAVRLDVQLLLMQEVGSSWRGWNAPCHSASTPPTSTSAPRARPFQAQRIHIPYLLYHKPQ
jgi:hypothetical protein